MSIKYRIYQVNSFTKELFRGNPAGVVPNADGLTDEQMQNIARELNNSETAFIFKPSDNSHHVRVRFFTPTTEVPSCGHATIAAHYVRSIENNLQSCTVVQNIKAGILPVDIIKEDDDYKIIMTQAEIEFSEAFGNKVTRNIQEALNLRDDDLDKKCPIQIVSTGHSKVLVGIKNLRTLNSLKPNMLALSKLSKKINCNGYFVFALDTNEEGVLTKGRMFAPAIGIMEDPVTGNANGPLGAYLVKHKLVTTDGKVLKYKGKQGEAINRTGIVEVDVEIENGIPKKVKVGGNAKIVFKSYIEL